MKELQADRAESSSALMFSDTPESLFPYSEVFLELPPLSIEL